MNRTSPSTPGPDDALGLFPNDAEWVRTQVLDARAIGTCEFDLDEFAQYRRIRILTYSSSVQMLSTVLDRFEEASVECVLGYSRAVNDMAAIVVLQTATMKDIRSALLGLSAQRREAILKRVREGRLQVRVVEGHVSHAKIFLLSDGPEGDRCVLTGSANFSTSALLGDQHEVLIRFRDDRAWDHFEGQYLEVRNHASAEVPIANLAEDRLDPAEEISPDAAPVLAPGRGAQVIQLARPADSDDSVERGRRVEKLYDVVLPALPKDTRGTGKSTLKLDGTMRKRFSGLIRTSNPTAGSGPSDLLPRPRVARCYRLRVALAAGQHGREGPRRCRIAGRLLGRLSHGVSRARRQAPARLLRLPVLDVLLAADVHAAPPGRA